MKLAPITFFGLLAACVSCAAFEQNAPIAAGAIAAGLRPLLPELVTLYRQAGDQCIASSSTAEGSSSCLTALRASWVVWDALEPLRGTLEQLAELERGWRDEMAKRYPSPVDLRCAVSAADAGAK